MKSLELVVWPAAFENPTFLHALKGEVPVTGWPHTRANHITGMIVVTAPNEEVFDQWQTILTLILS